MIQTAMQLKALIRNRAKGDSGKSQLLLRNYAMERFLERLSLSEYGDNFILKGGMLISSMVGVDMRATQDIDTTIRNFSLNEKQLQCIITDIISIPLEDNMSFQVKSISNIMDDMEYSGLRITMDAYLDKTRIPMKIDVSTGDIITPSAIQYKFPLMFENRFIVIQAYNMETVMAEKMETIVSKSVLNTRMRDYYDIYILGNTYEICINDLYDAFLATSKKRRSEAKARNYQKILKDIISDKTMKRQWETYQQKNEYAKSLEWNELMNYLFDLFAKVCKKIN